MRQRPTTRRYPRPDRDTYNILRDSQKTRSRFRIKMFKSSQTVVTALCYLFIRSSLSATLPSLIGLSQPLLNESDASSFALNLNTSRFTEPTSHSLVIDLSSNQTFPNDTLATAPAITLNQSASDDVLISAGISVSNRTNFNDIDAAQPVTYRSLNLHIPPSANLCSRVSTVGQGYSRCPLIRTCTSWSPKQSL